MGFELEIMEGRTVCVCEKERDREKEIKIYQAVTYKIFTVFHDVAFFFSHKQITPRLEIIDSSFKRRLKIVFLHSQFTHEATLDSWVYLE